MREHPDFKVELTITSQGNIKIGQQEVSGQSMILFLHSLYDPDPDRWMNFRIKDGVTQVTVEDRPKVGGS